MLHQRILQDNTVLLFSVERALPLGEAHDIELKRTRDVDKEVLLLRAILRYAFNTTSGQRGWIKGVVKQGVSPIITHVSSQLPTYW